MKVMWWPMVQVEEVGGHWHELGGVAYGLWMKLKKSETLIWVDFVECPKVKDEKMEDLDMDLME